MNRLSDIYYTTESYLFPMVEEEIGEITEKMKEFLRILEVVRPSRFLTNALRWCGLGRPMKDREKIFRAFLLKSVYDFPTTKLLIENLKTNPGLRRLCGWEYSRKDSVLLKIIFPTYRKIAIGAESVTVRVKLLIGEGINCILRQGMEMCRWQRF